MSTLFRIAPSILSADFARLGEEVSRVVEAGADLIHFDVMDNHYVPNLTFGPMVCAALKPYAAVPVDVHLMVEPVDDLIQSFAKAGADIITFHPEASRHVDRSLSLIKDLGCQAGLVLNPATPVYVLENVLDRLDMVLLMSVNPGFGGQSFIPQTLVKIRQVRDLLDMYEGESGRHVALATKMADSPEQVLAFLHDLARRAKPFAEKDLAELQAFARDTLGLAQLQAWDVAYAGEKLRQAKYAFSETEVKKYFPVNKVLGGLFAQIHRLYGVNLMEKRVPVWHPDVRYFELEKGGSIIGGVYLDLYAREGKRGGAWMNDYRGRRCFTTGDKIGQMQTPVAYLVCNFTPPVGGKEARLSHDEIITLFHETGHGLHHLLTQVDELGVSGINGVEWDAVELPSQFMENFVWEYDVLAEMSAHEENGAPLPRALFDKMVAAKNFQRGMFMVRQMEFALFDMQIYSQSEEGRLNEWPQVLEAVRREVSVVQPPAYNRFALSFGHIFAGGYSAGYYSYSWAEVLSADAYAAFEESDDVKATGKRFWQEVLAVGGSRSAMESFKAFRGREPKIDALLRHSGFDADAA